MYSLIYSELCLAAHLKYQHNCFHILVFSANFIAIIFMLICNLNGRLLLASMGLFYLVLGSSLILFEVMKIQILMKIMKKLLLCVLEVIFKIVVIIYFYLLYSK
jgi:hypothetical protein